MIHNFTNLEETCLVLGEMCLVTFTLHQLLLRGGIATDYVLDESRWGQKCSFLRVIQTGSGVHPASYAMGTGALYRGGKRPGREAHHSLPTSAEVKKTWVYTSTSPYVFMEQCLIS
jgi:hypothetical protein